MATILEFPDSRARQREQRAQDGADATGRILLFTGIRYERHAIPDPEEATDLELDAPPVHERN